MQLTPRYDGPTVLRFEVAVGDPSVPLLRQRRRFAQTLSAFSAAEWSAPSRCEKWSARDVVSHLVGTNQFWAASIASGLRGEPTRFLASFDPVATPAAMVEHTRAQSPAEVLASFNESLDALAAAVSAVPDDGWATLAEAPPGHIELRGVVLHALWDSWTHERDVLLPLGMEQPLIDDEVRACLFYSAAISPALATAGGSARRGALAIDATAPDEAFVVDVDECVVVRDRRADDAVTAELRGGAVDLIEGLTFRAPLQHDIAADQQWLLGGLAEVFDR